MYYTYAYLREDGTPYYIGKGSNDRAHSTCRTIPKPNDKNRILFLKQNLTEKEAFRHEKYMIAVLGRKDLGTGILRNFTDGGEGNSGRIHSEETKNKIGKSQIGKPISKETRKRMSDAHKGKTFTKEHRKKISESRIGEKHPFYGKSLSEEHKKRMSEVNKGKIISNETKRKMSDAAKKRSIKNIKIKQLKEE